jgi:biopolymer transport protein ExbD
MNKTLLLLILSFVFCGCAQVVAFIGSFVTTTTMSQPESIRLNVPGDEKKVQTLPSENDITILIYDENKIYSYKGADISVGAKYSYSGTNSIREYLKKKKNEEKDNLIVIIKPLNSSTYKGVVGILDEMSVNDIKKYSLIDPSDDDEQFIKQLK